MLVLAKVVGGADVGRVVVVVVVLLVLIVFTLPSLLTAVVVVVVVRFVWGFLLLTLVFSTVVAGVLALRSFRVPSCLFV